MTDQPIIDDRQRQAAALILAAMQFPADAEAVVEQWRCACRIYPGLTVKQAQIGSRIGGLQQARVILDELIAEATPEPEPPCPWYGAAIEALGRIRRPFLRPITGGKA